MTTTGSARQPGTPGAIEAWTTRRDQLAMPADLADLTTTPPLGIHPPNPPAPTPAPDEGTPQ